MLTNVTIVNDEYGDWQALYFQGVKKIEGHSLSIEEVLETLNIPFNWLEIKNEFFDANGALPTDLKAIPKRVIRK